MFNYRKKKKVVIHFYRTKIYKRYYNLKLR